MPTYIPVDDDPFTSAPAPAAEASGEPSFVPVEHDPFAKEPERPQRGLISDIGSHLARGVVSTVGQIGNMLEVAGTGGYKTPIESSGIARLGKKLTDFEAAAPTEYNYGGVLTPSKGEESEGFIRRGIGGTFESAPQSLTPTLAGAAAGAAVGSVVPGLGTTIGGITGGVLGTLGVFGAGSWGKAYKEAKAAGKTEDEARSLAWWDAAFEGGVEELANVAELLTMGGAKLIDQPFKQGLKSMLKVPAKELAKRFGETAVEETATEMIQNSAEAWKRQQMGMETQTPGQAALESIVPAVGMSLLFGAGTHAINKYERAKVLQNLNSEDPKARADAAGYIYNGLKEQDKDLAEAWGKSAEAHIKAGSKINVDQPVADFASFKTAVEQSTKKSAGVVSGTDVDNQMETAIGAQNGKSEPTTPAAVAPVAPMVPEVPTVPVTPEESVAATPITRTGGFTEEAIPPVFKSMPLEELQKQADTGVKWATLELGIRNRRTAEIDQAAHEAATSPLNETPVPTEAQTEAGNYQKGHINLHGLDISIENPAGSTRSGTNAEGKKWESTLKDHYGYIKRTNGADGDHVDTFIGSNPSSEKVFVVNQVDPKTGKFDEHKVMLGYDTAEAASEAYHRNYEPGWTGAGNLHEMSLDDFKGWLKNGDTKAPTAELLTREQMNDVKTIKEDDNINGITRKSAGEMIVRGDVEGALKHVQDGLDRGVHPQVMEDAILNELQNQGYEHSDDPGAEDNIAEAHNKVMALIKEEKLKLAHPGEERRSAARIQADEELKAQVKALLDTGNVEEANRRMNYEPRTGLKNARAWHSVNQEGKAAASIDVAGLGFANTVGGFEYGNVLLKGVANLLNETGLDVYHIGGDEFAILHDNEADMQESLKKVQKDLNSAILDAVDKDGNIIKSYTGWSITYATGKDFTAADHALKSLKDAAKEAGTAVDKGKQPRGVLDVTAERNKNNVPGSETQVISPQNQEYFDKAQNELALEYQRVHGVPLPEPVDLRGILQNTRDIIAGLDTENNGKLSRFSGPDGELNSSSFNAGVKKGKRIISPLPKQFKGYGKQIIVRALDRAIRGDALSVKQQDIVDKALEQETRRIINTAPPKVELQTDELRPGMEFTRDGEKFKVQEIDDDGNLVVKDGVTMKFQPGDTVEADDGSLKEKTEEVAPAEAQPTYDSIQKKIDDYETALESQGVDLSKLSDLSNKGNIASAEDMKRWGYVEMPKELADLYRQRAAISKGERQAGIQHFQEQFAKQGFTPEETSNILKKVVHLSEDGMDYMVGEDVKSFFSNIEKSSYERLYRSVLSVLKERGELSERQYDEALHVEFLTGGTADAPRMSWRGLNSEGRPNADALVKTNALFMDIARSLKPGEDLNNLKDYLPQGKKPVTIEAPPVAPAPATDMFGDLKPEGTDYQKQLDKQRMEAEMQSGVRGAKDNATSNVGEDSLFSGGLAPDLLDQKPTPKSEPAPAPEAKTETPSDLTKLTQYERQDIIDKLRQARSKAIDKLDTMAEGTALYSETLNGISRLENQINEVLTVNKEQQRLVTHFTPARNRQPLKGMRDEGALSLGGKSRTFTIEDTPENRADIERMGLKFTVRDNGSNIPSEVKAESPVPKPPMVWEVKGGRERQVPAPRTIPDDVATALERANAGKLKASGALQKLFVREKLGVEGKSFKEKVTALKAKYEYAMSLKGDGDNIVDLHSFNPLMAVKEIADLVDNLHAASPKLVDLGVKVCNDGKTTFSQWAAGMREYLGDLYDKFKGLMLKVWKESKMLLNNHGSIDFFKNIGDSAGIRTAEKELATPAGEQGAFISPNGISMGDMTDPHAMIARDILKAMGATVPKMHETINELINKYGFVRTRANHAEAFYTVNEDNVRGLKRVRDMIKSNDMQLDRVSLEILSAGRNRDKNVVGMPHEMLKAINQQIMSKEGILERVGGIIGSEVRQSVDRIARGQYGGLSTEAVGGMDFLNPGGSYQTELDNSEIGFNFDAVEAQMEEARGLKKDSLKDRIKAHAVDAKNSFVRAFPHLEPKTDGVLTDIFRQFKAVPNWAKSKAAEDIHNVVKDLSEDQYNIFRKSLVIADIMRDVNSGLLADDKLPFGYKNGAMVKAHLRQYDIKVKDDPKVQRALAQRGKIMGDMRRALVDAKILKPTVLGDDPNTYFHHQVHEYMAVKRGLSTGSKDVRLHTKGWQIAREGSFEAYNTEYAESEFEVLAQMYSQLETVKTRDKIQAESDMAKTLKAEAKSENLKNFYRPYAGLIDATTGKPVDPLMPFKQKIAMAMSKLGKMASDGELPGGQEFGSVISDLAARHEDEDYDMETDSKGLFRYLSFLLENKMEGAMQAATIFKAVRERENLIKSELGPKFVTDVDMISRLEARDPQKWVAWNPDAKKLFYPVNTLSDNILEAVLAGSRNLTDQDVQAAFAIRPAQHWIIPERVALTLDNFREIKSDTWLGKASGSIMSSWKQWVLIQPLRFLKYNTNNMSGDADIVMAYDPAIFKKAYAAAAHLWRRMHEKEMSPEWTALMDRAVKKAVMDSGLTLNEIPDIKDVGAFQALLSQNKAGLIEKGWNWSKDMTNFRENILRLAAYQHLAEKLGGTRWNGKRLYGASKQTELDAMYSKLQGLSGTEHAELVDDIAAKIARELVGDYGNVSEAGQWIRKHMIPFYSWVEINAPRYVRLFKNVRVEDDGSVGRMGGVTAWKFAKFGAKALALYTLITLWNNTFWPDEEEELGAQGRKQLHIILGRGDDGQIISMRFAGALSDALSWFGLENFPEDYRQILEGKKSWSDQAKEAFLAPAQKLIGGARPVEKTIGEALVGKTIYPDITKPRPIRDTAEHIFRALSLDMPYRYFAGKPTRATNDAISVLAYSSDPGEAAYYDFGATARKFLEGHDVEVPSITPTAKSNALYYYKQAVKYKDDTAAAKYLAEYKELGGKRSDMIKSVKKMKPMAMVPSKYRAKLMKSLSPADKEQLKLANKWWHDTYMKH